MNLARPASVATYLFLLVACTSAPLPGTANDPGTSGPVNDPAPPGAAAAGPSEPSTSDASPPREPGPSFTVQPEELSIDNVLAPSNQSPHYSADVDPTTLESGKPAMLLASKDGATASGFGATTATRALDGRFVGRRYRMRAKMKTEDALAAWLWWRIDGPGFFDLDNMGRPVDRRVRGTTDWREITMVMDVAPGATGFAFGSGLTGQGKVWVSAITFEEVGSDVPVTPSFGSGE